MNSKSLREVIDMYATITGKSWTQIATEMDLDNQTLTSAAAGNSVTVQTLNKIGEYFSHKTLTVDGSVILGLQSPVAKIRKASNNMIIAAMIHKCWQ